MRTCNAILILFAGLSLVITGCGGPDTSYNTTGESQYSPQEIDELNTTTIERMVAIAAQVEEYIVANPEVGAPKADDINHLLQVLADNNLAVEGAEPTDAFGHEFAYRHYFSFNEIVRKDYDLISFGEDGVQDLWRVTDHIRDTFFGQDIVWRHQSAVTDRSGFTHGPTLIRKAFRDFIAPSPAKVKMEY